MPNKLYTPSEANRNSLWGVNRCINNDRTKIPSSISNNEIDGNRDKFREQKRKWHPSKLEGYVSDEFRNVEFAD